MNERIVSPIAMTTKNITMSWNRSESSHPHHALAEVAASAASRPKRRQKSGRRSVSVTKNRRALTSSAPAARTNGVNGNGGGIRLSTASAIAPF